MARYEPDYSSDESSEDSYEEASSEISRTNGGVEYQQAAAEDE